MLSGLQSINFVNLYIQLPYTAKHSREKTFVVLYPPQMFNGE